MLRFALVAVIAILVSASPALSSEVVHFNGAPLPPSPFKVRLAQERGEPAPPPEPGIEVTGWLSKPEGPGPFPAVIFLHGCGEHTEDIVRATSARTVGWGYVYLGVDSNGPRGLKDACQGGAQFIADRVRDAHGALDYLAGLPFVDPDRIAVMGASQGGFIALLAIERNGSERPSGRRFKAAVTQYPICLLGQGSVSLSVPTLVLVGELDDWTPADRCREMKDRLAPDSAPVTLVIYPNAYHAFTSSRLGDRPMFVFGHRLEYNEAAAKSALAEMRTFLEQNLRR